MEWDTKRGKGRFRLIFVKTTFGYKYFGIHLKYGYWYTSFIFLQS